jgi:hypothetical protein
MLLDFARTRHDAGAIHLALQKVEDLLLSGGEHAVHANTRQWTGICQWKNG